MKPVLQTVISGQLYLGMHTHVALLSRRLARVRTRLFCDNGPHSVPACLSPSSSCSSTAIFFLPLPVPWLVPEKLPHRSLLHMLLCPLSGGG